MSRRRKPPQTRQPKPWVPLQRARPILTDSQQRVREKLGEPPDPEMWMNDRYVVVVTRSPEGHVMHLSIRRADRKAIRDWRHFQRIKNELAGPDAEAVELYPAENRVVDGANQFHLWVFPPGVQIPVGFNVDDSERYDQPGDDELLRDAMLGAGIEEDDVDEVFARSRQRVDG